MRAAISIPCNAQWKKKSNDVPDNAGLAARVGLGVRDGLSLPSDLLVVQPSGVAGLLALREAGTTLRVLHPVRPLLDQFVAHGFDARPEIDLSRTDETDGVAEAVLICLPRSKVEALAMLADAARQARDMILVDGQKTDGVDSVLKAVKARVPIEGLVSKAHGKLFWFRPEDVFEDWAAGPAITPGGFWAAPGVFSADGVDEGSRLLAEALPETLKGVVADLGAGWGFLAAHVLQRPGVGAVHLVEAHHLALQCAEHNVTDPRARFHWADALVWEAPEPLDWVVMNPPFHIGRAADPELGQGFIRRAARLLKPKGRLCMVANRRLPYEETLAQGFRNVVELGGNGGFKVLFAEAPKNNGR